MAKIVLSTLNARYSHASFGLRYLMANMGELQSLTLIREFVVQQPTEKIAQEILSLDPTVVGLGVYIWNATETWALVHRLRQLQPSLRIVLGGPEVSHETFDPSPADWILKGEADHSFRELCEKIIRGEEPTQKVLSSSLPDLDSIQLPYSLYTEEDVANRVIYVEASRGCVYKCEYCLSSLDKGVRSFELNSFLDQMGRLIQRGVRQFKFVDRTFNLKPQDSLAILKFFLQPAKELGLFLHFEMVPDRLPEELRELISLFPSGSLQFEVGVQTWNPEVAALVSRRQNYSKIQENLAFLREKTGVHVHADLIAGLPGETWQSFAYGFDQLFDCGPQEIQLGILKRLKGTPIVRHDRSFEVRWDPTPPFTLQSNKDWSSEQIQRIQQMAKYWDLIANRGRFSNFMRRVRSLREQSGLSVFGVLEEASESLQAQYSRTYGLTPRQLKEGLLGWLKETKIETVQLASSSLELSLSMDQNHWEISRMNRVRGEKAQNSATPARQRAHQESRLQMEQSPTSLQ